ncbi:MAG: PINc/VapC family ATPase [Candidatus Bipolaricaulota bacterium]
MNEYTTYVPDTSILVDGWLSEQVDNGSLEDAAVVIPEAAVAELEAQASRGQETGYTGLDELKRLQSHAQKGLIDLSFKGRRPTKDQVELASSGEIDAMIRRLAEEEGAALITSDQIQASVAEGKGIPVQFVQLEGGREERDLEQLEMMKYFDECTMSLHLRANTLPRAKRGIPGQMEVVSVDDRPSSSSELESYIQEIIEVAGIHRDGFIEMDSGGSTVVQLGNLRIAIAKPPFSDAVEITATRPVTKTVLQDYSYSHLLKERMDESHRGVLVSGSPGMGKSTLVQAMAEFLEDSGWIVKTMEKPRDLDVSQEISQYTALEGHMANTADVLLLSRPDYTVFDEMRQTEDFEVFADMRMAGIGLVGVVHATKGIDALQRLVGRVELGMIPQIVDTVVYVDEGDVNEVFEVELTVKVPTGMEERDLSRPVIEVREFETSDLEYEIYSFGEEVVVMPVAGEERKPVWNLAQREVEYELNREFDFSFEVQILADNRLLLAVADSNVPVVLGKGGRRVEELEQRLGMNIDVRPFSEAVPDESEEVSVEVTDEYVILQFDPLYRGKEVELTVNGQRVFNGAVSKNCDIRLRRGKQPAEKIRKAYREGQSIQSSIAGF